MTYKEYLDLLCKIDRKIYKIANDNGIKLKIQNKGDGVDDFVYMEVKKDDNNVNNIEQKIKELNKLNIDNYKFMSYYNSHENLKLKNELKHGLVIDSTIKKITKLHYRIKFDYSLIIKISKDLIMQYYYNKMIMNTVAIKVYDINDKYKQDIYLIELEHEYKKLKEKFGNIDFFDYLCKLNYNDRCNVFVELLYKFID